MRAFEVTVNGKPHCLAGIGDSGVLTTTVSWVAGGGRAELTLNVGGLVSATQEHMVWRSHGLRLGDQVMVTIVERDSVDKPRKRRRDDPAENLKSKKRYVRMMAKELGWRVQSLSRK